MMFTSKYRPMKLDQVCGQPLAVEAVRSILKRPEEAPKVYIFHGEFGTGKTSMARLLARLLNEKAEGSSQETFSSGFREYDASVAGNKEDLILLRDDLFTRAYGVRWRVVVLDEFHLASRQGQSTLLKTLEALPENVFIVFCTTRVSSIIPTIRSRAVEVAFQRVSNEDLKYYLVKLVNSEGIEVADTLLDYMVRRAQGHVRDAVMMLDSYQSLGGEEAFLEVYRDSTVDVLAFLWAVHDGNDDGVEAQIGRLTGYPVDVVRYDIFGVVTELLRRYTLPTLVEGVQTTRPSTGATRVGEEEREPGSLKGSGTPGPPYISVSSSLPSYELLYPEGQQLPHGIQGRVPEVRQPRVGNSATQVEGPGSSSSHLATTYTRVDEIYRDLAARYGRSLLDVLAYISTDWAVNCLADMARLQGFLWSMYARFRSRTQGDPLSSFKKK